MEHRLPGGQKHGLRLCKRSQNPHRNPIHEVASVKSSRGVEKENAASCLRKFGVNLIFK